nr:unknown [Ipomoea trifida]
MERGFVVVHVHEEHVLLEWIEVLVIERKGGLKGDVREIVELEIEVVPFGGALGQPAFVLQNIGLLIFQFWEIHFFLIHVILLNTAFLVVYPTKYPLIKPQIVSLAGGTIDVGEPVLVHNPVGLDSSRGFPGVENQRLLYP